MVSSVVQSAAVQATTTSVIVTLGTTPTVGNTLLAFVASDTTHSAVPIAGASRGFTQRLSQVNNQGFYVWTRAVVSGDTSTITFTASSASPSSAHVVEVQGTYDTIGTGTTTINTAGASRTTNSVTPTNADNTVLALAGIHGIQNAESGGAADNGFALTLANYPAGAGLTLASTVSTQKFTGVAAATGVTTISWTGNSLDRDGVQVAFAGVTVNAGVLPEIVMAQTRR